MPDAAGSSQLTYVAVAFGLTWATIGFYMFYLARRVRHAEQTARGSRRGERV
jgi:CcmD family protein